MAAESLTDVEFAKRVGIPASEWAGWAKRGAPVVGNDRRPWPQTLHWWIELRERDARRQIPTDVNQTDFASVIGISSRQVRNLFAVGLPATDAKERRVKLVEALTWWIQYKINESGGKKVDESDLEELYTRRARRKIAELDLAERMRQLVRVDEVAHEIEEIFANVHSALKELEERLVARIGEQYRQIVHTELRAAAGLMEDNVAEWAKRAANSLPDTDEEMEPVSASDST